MRKITRTRAATLAGVVVAALALPTGSATAATGDRVASVQFSVPCPSGVGVGIAFDGANLWYSCAFGGTDLYRADPITGQVTASYTIAGGLGALAYDAGRNAIWAGYGNSIDKLIRRIPLDAAKNALPAIVVFDASHADLFGLNDGLAYDAEDDSLYLSADGSTTIHHYSSTGVHLTDGPNGTGDFAWAGDACFNSGLAIGGDLLYQGANGCTRIWVVDKSDPATVVFSFSTNQPGDPSFRDEDLECDTNTFAAQGKHVMWSVEAYEPRRALAFEIPLGSCGVGGQPPQAEEPDHYKGYQLQKRKAPKKTGITLLDRFGGRRVTVKDAQLLLNPVEKTRGNEVTPIADPDLHLTCYDIKDEKDRQFPKFRPRVVDVADQFGDHELDVRKPRLLCAPTSKSRTAQPPPAVPDSTDHYQCYDVISRSRFAPQRGVLLEDQFGSQRVTVKEPVYLCPPVEKRHRNQVFPIHNEDHLLCYSIAPEGGAPFGPVRVRTRDQFGLQSREVQRPQVLCTPAG